MQRKILYLIAASVLLIGVLAAAWWGWSKAGMAVLQLGVGIC
ncbi:MAG: hypothetical protein RBR45_09470 [Pseudomonas sp.]|jgi:hypothetical protein|nr:hypothetical protein [Pseudomonas sp.]